MRGRVRSRSSVVLALVVVPSFAVVATHPLPGPHRFECQLLGPGAVLLTWDELGTDPTFHRALLHRDGEPIAELAPESTSYVDEPVASGRRVYRLDIVPRGANDVVPIATRECVLEVAAVACQVFGGVATPPVLEVTWVLSRAGASEVRVLVEGDVVAVLPGDSNHYTQEPFGGRFEVRVDAVYRDEVVVIGACIVDWQPPVIGGLQRGDCNGDGRQDVSDAVCMLEYLFLGGRVGCEQTADVDDSGVIELTDPIVLLAHLFQGGPPPAPPFPDCGHEVTPDELSCFEHAPCFTPPPP